MITRSQTEGTPMASSFDLAPRLAALQSSGLNVASDYQGTPAKWLQHALDSCDVRVINVKGSKADDVPVMVRLSTLEELVGVVTAETP